MDATLNVTWADGRKDQVTANNVAITMDVWGKIELFLYIDGENAAALRPSAESCSECSTTPATLPASRYVEPDPRTVKCPVCPHTADKHTDSGCCATHVTDKEWRSPGVQGYCKCARTYPQVMLSHKMDATAER